MSAVTSDFNVHLSNETSRPENADDSKRSGGRASVGMGQAEYLKRVTEAVAG